MSTKSIAWITGTLILLLTLFSFVLSFNALSNLAATHNVSIPYLFPLVVEAGVIIFSLNALYRLQRTLSRKKSRSYGVNWPIQNIEALAGLAADLDEIRQDFESRRRLVEMLNVQATLKVEDGQKVVHAGCLLGNGNLLIACNFPYVDVH